MDKKALLLGRTRSLDADNACESARSDLIFRFDDAALGISCNSIYLSFCACRFGNLISRSFSLDYLPLWLYEIFLHRWHLLSDRSNSILSSFNTLPLPDLFYFQRNRWKHFCDSLLRSPRYWASRKISNFSRRRCWQTAIDMSRGETVEVDVLSAMRDDTNATRLFGCRHWDARNVESFRANLQYSVGVRSVDDLAVRSSSVSSINNSIV